MVCLLELMVYFGHSNGFDTILTAPNLGDASHAMFPGRGQFAEDVEFHPRDRILTS